MLGQSRKKWSPDICVQSTQIKLFSSISSPLRRRRCLVSSPARWWTATTLTRWQAVSRGAATRTAAKGRGRRAVRDSSAAAAVSPRTRTTGRPASRWRRSRCRRPRQQRPQLSPQRPRQVQSCLWTGWWLFPLVSQGQQWYSKTGYKKYIFKKHAHYQKLFWTRYSLPLWQIRKVLNSDPHQTFL